MRHISLINTITLAAAFGFISTAAIAFDFKSAPVTETTIDQSSIHFWAAAKVEKGDVVDKYVGSFRETMKLGDVTNAQMYVIVAGMNKMPVAQLNHIKEGQVLLLPMMTQNTPKEIGTRRAERAKLAQLAGNPMMMATAIAQLSAGLKAKTVDEAVLKAAIDKALLANPMVSAAQFDLVRKDLLGKIAASGGVGVSETQVSGMIEEAFAAAGLPDQAAFDAIDSTLSTLDGRVAALETTMTTKADTSAVKAVTDSVTAIDGRVAALEKGGTSSSGLMLALLALVLAACAFGYALFFTASKKSVKVAATKAAADTAAANATAARQISDAEGRLAAANASTLQVAEDAKKLAVTAINNAAFVASLAIGKDLKFVGDLPNQAQIDALPDDAKFDVRLKQDDNEYVVTFTVKMDAFGVGEKGLIVGGIKDHRNAIKPRVERIGTLIKDAIGKSKLEVKVDPAATPMSAAA